MEKKNIAIILAVLLLLLGCFIGGQYVFASSDGSLSAYPAGVAASAINLTEEDFLKHPILKNLIEQRQWIPITDDPFVIMKLSTPHISKAEAAEILSAYAGTVYWDGVYYQILKIVA
ncbi:MAG: hypothetical protein LBL85_03225 [Methanocalculaceae archaeon]|jgi:hypothetical protein|nr:hypothetical protein [Methanocalculaceae archaeon]